MVERLGRWREAVTGVARDQGRQVRQVRQDQQWLECSGATCQMMRAELRPDTDPASCDQLLLPCWLSSSCLLLLTDDRGDTWQVWWHWSQCSTGVDTHLCSHSQREAGAVELGCIHSDLRHVHSDTDQHHSSGEQTWEQWQENIVDKQVTLHHLHLPRTWRLSVVSAHF